MSREEFDQALPAIMKLMEEEEVNVPKKEKGGNLTRQIHYFNRILSGLAIQVAGSGSRYRLWTGVERD